MFNGGDMKREEAKDLLFNFVEKGMTMKNVSFEMAIDEIYDDLESRTCENCKHYQEIEWYGKEIIHCTKLSDTWGSMASEHIFNEGKDFGCNRWEQKQC